LLHDVGHSSFSHQFNRTSTIKTALAKEGRFEQLWENSEYQDIYQSKPSPLEHEHFSVRAAYEILSDITEDGLDLAILDILSLMETTDIVPSQQFEQHAAEIWPLIAQRPSEQDRSPKDLSTPKEASSLTETMPEQFAKKLQHVLASIVSGELDADRADYMLRDGFHSSVTIGGFNLDHLLSNLHFGWCSQTKWFGLAISEKGLSSLEDFVYSRHQMYRQVYAHKTAQGFDWLLRAAIDEVMQQPHILKFVDQCLSDIYKFKHLTDSYFWEAFRQYADTHTNSYSNCILERNKMRYITTRENLSAEEEQHYLSFLAKEHQTEQLVASSITARFTKIKEGFTDMKVLVSDHQHQKPTLRSISNTSRFFDKFTDEKITHFYLNPVIQENS